DCSPAFRVRRCQAPGALPTHRDAGQINSCRVHSVILLDLVDYRQGTFAVFGSGLPTALVRLREDSDKFERFLLLDRRGQADPDLVAAVSAGLASTMEEQDYRKCLLAVVISGDEYHVLCFVAIGPFVHLVDETG